MASSDPNIPTGTTTTTNVDASTSQELLDEDFGKYTLKRHLATGGMAEIYLAEQVGPEGFTKEIVIKRILPHLAKDEQFTEMFLDEARLAANLNHPNIGQIHELGEAAGDYFIAMEFIDGASVEELLEGDGDVPVEVSARIVADVLQALDFAHESKDREGNALGLVHRDVTPSNVMVSIDGIVKLVDFGVAKAAKKSHKTQTGAVKGKFAYMAPEQVESQAIDRRADIFAIGCVFYELMTGVKPFGDELAAVSKILHEDPKDPRELDASVPEPFARIVMRALQKKPDARYPTAHTMLLDIETALRMENSYVGPRELSFVVRTFRGLEIPPGMELSVHDTGLFAADRSSDFAAVTTPVKSTPQEKNAIALAETAAIDVAAADGSTEVRGSQPASPPTRRLPPLPSKQTAMVGGGVLVAVLLVVGVASLLSGRESVSPLVTGEPREVVLNTTPLVEDGASPEALHDSKGAPVFIDSIPAAKLYRRGKFVGTTPVHTTLSPGKYNVDLEVGDERKKASFKVEKGQVNRERFVFASLGEDDSPSSKRKRSGRKRGFLRNLLPGR